MTCDRSNPSHIVHVYIDPLTHVEEPLEHCPLSIPDGPAFDLLETVHRWESGQIRIDYATLCDMPPMLLEASDFVKSCKAQMK